MVKKNLSSLDRQYCPCQNELPEPGWQASTLVEVKTRQYYERKHDPGDQPTMFSSGPNIPTTDEGVEIIRDNFPDSNFVCPECGKKFLAVVDVYPLEDKGTEPELKLNEEDWSHIEQALKTHDGLSDEDLSYLISKIENRD